MSSIKFSSDVTKSKVRGKWDPLALVTAMTCWDKFFWSVSINLVSGPSGAIHVWSHVLNSAHSVYSMLDPEIDPLGRSSRSFDVGVELSWKSRRKLSWSIESVVRLWNRVSRFIAVKSTFLTLFQGRRHGVDWGGHVHPTFVRGRSWDWRKSGEFLLRRRGLGRSRFGTWRMKKICCFRWAAKAKRFSASGGKAPDYPWPGALPCTPTGGSPQTPL